MLFHDLRLSLRSIRQTPFLSALIVIVIATGIGTSVVAMTLYHARAGNPIWWKNDVLFRVMLDSRPARQDDEGRHPEYPPFTLIYRDAIALYQSKLPDRSVMEFYSAGLVNAARPDMHPVHTRVRLTTHAFFSMFDVPFRYGQGWSEGDDQDEAQVVVISRYLNDSLFAGENSIGRSLVLNGHPFKVIGVLDRWLPLPRFYDEAKDFGPPDDLFIPFRWIESIPDLAMSGFCLQSQTLISGFPALAPSDCLSPIGIWVELDSAGRYRDYHEFLDNYARAQQQNGRFARPVNNHLAKVSTWLTMNDVVGNENRIYVLLALVFLGVCTLNALGLVLAKFLGRAPIAGLQRAFGATRVDILRQHLMEVVLLGGAGGGAGMLLALLGLRLIRIFVFSSRLHANPEFAMISQSLSHIDATMALSALLLSLSAGLLAGAYPAWRVAKLPPAAFLKTQ